MNLLLKNVRAVLPNSIERCDVHILDGRIAAIAPHIMPCKGGEVRDCDGALLMPGFIDSHIHGGLSQYFMDPASDLGAITEHYARCGTTSIAPTFSARPYEMFEAAARHVVGFCRTPYRGAKIAGIHAEGPFLSTKRPGGMPTEYFAKPTVEQLDKMITECDGLLRILTLAPEVEGALDVIAYAVQRGIAVSAGHTNATYDEMKAAINAGLTRMTHAFNASRPINHREPGVLMAAFDDKRVNCEAICDFGHLHPSTVNMIYQLKGADGFTAVSDCSDRRGYTEPGEGEHVTADGVPYTVWHGVAWSQSGGVMGCGNNLAVGVRNLHSLGIPLTEVAVMASANPAKALGIFEKTGSIEIGKAADLVLVDDELNVLSTFVDGKEYEGE